MYIGRILIIMFLYKGKSNIVSVCKQHSRSRDIAPRILSLGSGELHAPAALLCGKEPPPPGHTLERDLLISRGGLGVVAKLSAGN
jgi:hypothetical protein